MHRRSDQPGGADERKEQRRRDVTEVAQVENASDAAQQSDETEREEGCSPATADLIRHPAEPIDRQAGEALRLADEAN